MKVSVTGWIGRTRSWLSACRRATGHAARAGILPFTIITLSLPAAFSAAGQQRPLTAADLRPTPAPVVPPTSGLRQGTSSERTESLLLAPYDDTALRLVFDLTGAEFLKGVDTARLIREAAAQRAEAMRELLPDIRRSLEADKADAAALMAPGRMDPASGTARSSRRSVPSPRITVVRSGSSAPVLMPAATSGPTPSLRRAVIKAPVRRQWPNPGQTSTIVAEYEIVVNGITTNIREEVSLIFETRQVGFRHVQRETIERNDDPAAVGRYTVESGTIDADGTSTVKAAKARRLKPTSTHRMTTESIREARVDRCPDPAGLTRGQTRASVSIRATTAATGNGSPLLTDITAQGTSTGRVDDAAALTGFDWEVTAETRMESLGTGENFRLADGMSMRYFGPSGGPAPNVTMKGVTVTGVGSTETAQKMRGTQEKLFLDTFLPLLQSYDHAENSWRGGGCIALTTASGAEPARLSSGEARRLVVEARHRHETEPPAVPVAGSGSRGTLTPADPVRTPAAAFVFTPEAGGKGGGSVTFKSTSRRGIARNMDVYFDEVDVESISVEYVYSGFAFVDSTAEDCPNMRPDGREVLTARLRLLAVVDGSRRYEGTGRFSADIDGCGLTPDRKDPGRAEGNSGFGGFVGDNFLGCKVTTVVPDRAVRVSLRVSPPEDGSPGAIEIEWTPAATAADPRVTSPCEPPWHAEQVKRLRSKYRGRARVEISDEDLMPKMLDGGDLRSGTYKEPNGSAEGMWTLTLRKTDGRTPAPE